MEEMVNRQHIGVPERRTNAQCGFREKWFNVDISWTCSTESPFLLTRRGLRLRLIQSLWHHVTVRHSEKPQPSESDIGYCFLFLSVYRIAISAFVWEVPSTPYVQGNGSDAGIVFQWCFQLPSTNAFGPSLSVSVYRRLLHFRKHCCNRSAVTNCCNSSVTLSCGECPSPFLWSWDTVRTPLTIAKFTASISVP